MTPLLPSFKGKETQTGIEILICWGSAITGVKRLTTFDLSFFLRRCIFENTLKKLKVSVSIVLCNEAYNEMFRKVVTDKGTHGTN